MVIRLKQIADKYKNVLSENSLSLLQFGIENKIPIIIGGNEKKPTGKSTLLHDLLDLGADAAEVWEIQEGDKQHYKKSDKNSAYILITLNEERSEHVEHRKED